MNHTSARAAVDELFVGKGTRNAQLRVHLDGCLECRAYYDRAARAFRALAGKPDEMTPEELSLFAPPFPAEAPGPMLRFAPWIGGFALAATAALVVVVATRSGSDGFTARGGGKGEKQPAVRALCSRQVDNTPVVVDPATGGCLAGDRLGFVAVARGRKYVAVAFVEGEQVEWVLSGAMGALGPGDDEAMLAVTSSWRPGLRGVALWSAAPIDPVAAEPCARAHCPAALERTEFLLGAAR